MATKKKAEVLACRGGPMDGLPLEVKRGARVVRLSAREILKAQVRAGQSSEEAVEELVRDFFHVYIRDGELLEHDGTEWPE